MPSLRKRSPDSEPPAAFRASVTFPAGLYQALEALARQKKVSLAWVVRDAVERYAAELRKPDTKKRPSR